MAALRVSPLPRVWRRPGPTAFLSPALRARHAHARFPRAVPAPCTRLATNKSIYGNPKRRFAIADQPFSLKAGVAIRSEDRANRRSRETRSVVGASGIANTADDSALPYLDANDATVDPYSRFRPIRWVSAH